MQGGSVFTQTQVPRLNGKTGFLGPIKVHSQFTSDAVEIWVHSGAQGPEEEDSGRAGSRTLVLSDITRPRGSRWECQVSGKVWVTSQRRCLAWGSEGSWEGPEGLALRLMLGRDEE